MYRGLCSRSTPVTEMLFGKDMNNAMKQVAEAYKAGKKLTSDDRKRQSSYRCYVPYNQYTTAKGPPVYSGRTVGDPGDPTYPNTAVVSPPGDKAPPNHQRL